MQTLSKAGIWHSMLDMFLQWSANAEPGCQDNDFSESVEQATLCVLITLRSSALLRLEWRDATRCQRQLRHIASDVIQLVER